MRNMVASGTQVKASTLEAGTVVMIFGGTERVEIMYQPTRGYGATIINDGVKCYGLGDNEMVTVLGYFNV